MNSYKALQIKLAKKLSGDFLGSFMSAFRGHGMEFENLREYVPGDSVKKIDWKTTAKQNKAFIKNFNEERDINALFVFDLSESLLFGSREQTKLDTAKEVFYMLGSAASSNGFRLGSQLGNTYFDFASGNKNIIRTLNYLDNLNNIPSALRAAPLKSKWSNSIQKNIKNSLIFIFSDQMDSNNLRVLSRYNDVVYVNIFDNLESQGSDNSFASSVGGMLSFFSAAKQSAYKNTHSNTLKVFKNSLKKKQVRYLAIDDTDNLVLSFYKFFAKTI